MGPHPQASLPQRELTVRAGSALPAVPADAGERVPAAHTGAPVHTGIGQAAAVLGCGGGEGFFTQLWGDGVPTRLCPRQGGQGQGAPHQCCRCCPSSRGGRRSGRCRRCHSRCPHCRRCKRHTGTHLQVHGAQWARPAAAGSVLARSPPCGGPAGTHASGRSCPSSRRHTRSRSR